MNIELIKPCVLCIDGTNYYTNSFVSEWMMEGKNVVVATYRDMVFIDTETKETSCVYNSVLEYSDTFFGDKVVLTLDNQIAICDMEGVVTEVYSHNMPRRLMVKCYDRYVLGILGPSHDVCKMLIYVREDMSDYIDNCYISGKYIIKSLGRGISIGGYNRDLTHDVTDIHHAIGPDMILTDGYNGFNEIDLIDNILTYVDSKGNRVTTKLPTKPKIPRKPVSDLTYKNQQYDEYELKHDKQDKQDKQDIEYQVSYYTGWVIMTVITFLTIRKSLY